VLKVPRFSRETNLILPIDSSGVSRIPSDVLLKMSLMSENLFQNYFTCPSYSSISIGKNLDQDNKGRKSTP